MLHPAHPTDPLKGLITMPKYRANADVLGIKARDTFVSDDPFYAQFVEGGFLTVLDADATEPEIDDDSPAGGDPDDLELGGPELGADLGNVEGSD